MNIEEVLKYLWNKITRRREIGEVLSSLEKPLYELKVLMEQSDADTKKNTETIAKLTAKNTQLAKDRTRAEKVHGNISTLLAVTD